MNASIAIYSGSMSIYWSSIVIAFGLAACLCLALALYTANGGRSAAVLLLLPLSLLFSIPLCRALHWYCHMEQYTGFFSALTDYSSGSYCLPGALLGVWLAALKTFSRSSALFIKVLLAFRMMKPRRIPASAMRPWLTPVTSIP